MITIKGAGDGPAPFHVRQGDVLVIAVTHIPDAAVALPPERGRVILAYGEATGHAHVVVGVATLLEHGEDRYLDVPAATTVVHEEHAPVRLPAGGYRVVIQREYIPAEIPGASWRRVVD